MTIRLREMLFRLFFTGSGLLSVLTLAGLWVAGPEGLDRAMVVMAVGSGYADFVFSLSLPGSLGLVAVAGAGFLAIKSGRTVSVELFFLSFWMFCLSLELLRFIPVFLLAVTPLEAHTTAMEFVTRTVLAARYAGTASLFAGSLFAVGLRTERIQAALLVSILAGLVFSSVQPLNSASPGWDWLAERGFTVFASGLSVTLGLLSIINHVVAWRSGHESAFLWAGFGLGLMVAGSVAMQLHLPKAVLLASMTGLATGAWIYGKSLHDHYLWR